MARAPESNEAFFREVDDEVRRAQVAGMARRYGVLAAILVVLGLVGYGGWLGWQSHVQSIAGERAETLTAAMSSASAGNKDAARKKLDPLVADGGTYGSLAGLTLADMQVQSGQQDQAAAAFLKIANDNGAPQPVRDLALVRATALAFDKLPPATVISRMKPLAAAGQPWFGSAAEMTAIAQIKLGQKKQAGALFGAIAKDTGTPQSLRERARQLAGDLGVDVDAGAPAIQG